MQALDASAGNRGDLEMRTDVEYSVAIVFVGCIGGSSTRDIWTTTSSSFCWNTKLRIHGLEFAGRETGREMGEAQPGSRNDEEREMRGGCGQLSESRGRWKWKECMGLFGGEALSHSKPSINHQNLRVVSRRTQTMPCSDITMLGEAAPKKYTHCADRW